jgi:hypothetical protein
MESRVHVGPAPGSLGPQSPLVFNGRSIYNLEQMKTAGFTYIETATVWGEAHLGRLLEGPS